MVSIPVNTSGATFLIAFFHAHSDRREASHPQRKEAFMFSSHSGIITVGSTSVVLLSAMLAGCATVSPDQMDTRLATLRDQLRAEISETDRKVTDLEGRVGTLENRTTTLERELDRLAREFSATVERLESALRFNVPVHFAFDEAELTHTTREILDRFARVIRGHHPAYLITVEGFTDPAGTAAYNLRLGQRRADAVRDYLTTEGGLPADRVRAVSYGEARNRLVAPQRQGPGEEGWENRRVSLVVDYAGR